MSGEFVNVLAAGLVLFIVFYIIVTPGILPPGGGPSGMSIFKQDSTRVTLAENAWSSSSLFSVVKTEGVVSDDAKGQKGLILPFKPNLKWFGDDGKAMVELTVLSPGKGTLIVILDGTEIYRGQPKPGKQDVYFDTAILTGEDVLEIKAVRGADFWTTANYDVKAEIKGEITSAINVTFVAPDRYGKAKLITYFDVSEGKLAVKLNGEIIYEGEPTDLLNFDLQDLKRANTIEFLPSVGSKHLVSWAEVRFT